MLRSLAAFSALSIAAVILSGCGLLAATFDAVLKHEFDVNGADNSLQWAQEVAVNTDDNQDIKDNRSLLVKDEQGRVVGTVREIRLEVVSLGASNQAKVGWGQAYVRKAGEEWPAEPYARFDAIPLVAGNNIKLSLTASRRAALADLVFSTPDLEVKFEGHVDQAPARFTAKVVFHVEFEASP